jgi:hypothetical protein
MALDHVADQDLESAMVLIVFVNALPLIAPADDVEQRARKMYAASSRHEPHLSQDYSNKQITKA